MLAIVGAVPLHVLSTGLSYLVGLLVAAMLAFVAYTALAGGSRLAAWLAQHHQLPARIAEPHPTTQAPFVAIAACGAAAALLRSRPGAAGGVNMLAGTYVFGALLAFTSVDVSVVVFAGETGPLPARRGTAEPPRRRPPDPVDRPRGRRVHGDPRIAVVLLQSDARYLGVAWMVLGLAAVCRVPRRLGHS